MGKITLNKEQELYAIQESYGYSCVGFSVLDNRARALATELGEPWNERTGTKKAYYQYRRLVALAFRKNKETGWRSASELHPQLIGLEGKRVEVTDQDGETYRFNVGKSTGPVPIHLRIHGSRSDGGPCVDMRTFKQVRVIK